MIIENKNENSFMIVNRGTVTDPDALSSDIREVLMKVCQAIREGGYNPISQLVGYILSDDPTHIANYNNARSLIGRIDRDDLIEDMVSAYIQLIENEDKTDK